MARHCAKIAHPNSTSNVSLPRYKVSLQLILCLPPFLILKETDNIITNISKDKCPSRRNGSLGKLSNSKLTRKNPKLGNWDLLEIKAVPNCYQLAP